MIISRTPFRISFFGGGTDYPQWIEKHGGAVFGTSINRYCYVSCRYLPPFFEHKYRIVYSKTEMTQTIDEIHHPVVNAVLNHLKYHDKGLEIHYDADLPARAGLGSSSAFTVGALNALLALKGISLPRYPLAEKAIFIEQKVLKEVVGSQDQLLTTHGGINHIDFFPDKTTSVHPVIAPPHRIHALEDHLMLFFTGFSRFASEVAKSKVANFSLKKKSMHRIREMVDESLEIVQNETIDLRYFGELLHEAWLLKRGLSHKISTKAIDEIYALARKEGAIGGKLLGAGGGGFMLLFVSPKDQERIKKSLTRFPKILHIPFSFENEGSRIIVYHPSGMISYD